MKRIIAASLILAFCCLLVGCYTFNHQVGTGAKGFDEVKERQWYVLFGLVPINKVDSRKMAGGAANYDVKTEFNVVDVIITAFTSVASVHCQTVTVTK